LLERRASRRYVWRVPPTRRRLITDRDIRLAHRAGERSIDVSRALVTPSARDAAAALGIALTSAPPAVTSAGTTSQPAVAEPASVTVGADHGGVAMKDAIIAHLRAAGRTVSDVGTFSPDAVDYPDYAIAVARAVAAGSAAFGIMVDGAGIGSCMAANKVKGVRAAMCYDVTTAANAREHNNANVLTLGGTLIGQRLALEIVDTFLRTSFGGGRHQRRVDKIDGLHVDGSR
jgi:ribose 5-phosphate isomerase B